MGGMNGTEDIEHGEDKKQKQPLQHQTLSFMMSH